jgi:hypothetical protein
MASDFHSFRQARSTASARRDESGLCAGGGGKIRPNPHFRLPNQHHRFGRLRQRVVDGQKSPSPALMTGRQGGHTFPSLAMHLSARRKVVLRIGETESTSGREIA